MIFMQTETLFEQYYNTGRYPFKDGICTNIKMSKSSCSVKTNYAVVPLGPKGKIGIPYKFIDCKNPRNVTIIKESKIVKPFLNKLKYSDICKTLNTCKNKSKRNLQYCGLDEFSNETFIGMAIEDIVKSRKFVTKSYVKQYNAYTCNMLGYNHMELCDLGDMSTKMKNVNNKKVLEFGRNKKRIVAHCLLQISHILHFLQTNCQYIHGDLKAGNVFIKNEPCRIKIDKYTVRCPVTFKLADYGKNSMNVGKYRLFNDHFIRKVIPQIKIKENNKMFQLNKFTIIPRYYRSQLLFSYLRHIGLPFIGDLDVYILIASLLLNEEYGKILKDFPLAFHKTLWISSQLPLISQHVINIKSRVSKHKISSVTTAMHFLTTKLSNGKYIVMKKNIAQNLQKVLFHLIKNPKLL